MFAVNVVILKTFYDMTIIQVEGTTKFNTCTCRHCPSGSLIMNFLNKLFLVNDCASGMLMQSMLVLSSSGKAIAYFAELTQDFTTGKLYLLNKKLCIR